MKFRCVYQSLTKCLTQLNDESKLCFGSAAAFFAVGLAGWLINLATPGQTTLHAVVVIGYFYFILGVIALFKKTPQSSQQAARN
jgi:hypothetical protein